MRMKKIIALAMSAALALTMLAGCGDKKTDGKDSSNVSKEGNSSEVGTTNTGNDEQIVLNWALWDWDATAYYQPIIDAYEKANPNVKIEYTDLGSTDYMNMLQTQLAGGADFDVVTIKDIPGYANLVAQNQLVPLNDFIEKENIDTSVYSGTVEQIAVDDTVYQLPFRSDFWVIFYNKGIFDELKVDYPTNDMTLDDYDKLAREIKTASDAASKDYYGAHYHTWRSAVQLFGILDGKNTIVEGEYAFLAPYYERIINEQKDNIVMSYEEATSTSSHYRDLFLNDKIAMMNMGTWYIGTQIEKVAAGETVLSADWGIAKYPHPDGVDAGTTLGTITGLSVSKNSKNQDAALDFVKFVTGEEGAAVVASTGTIPAIHSESVMQEITSLDGYPQDEISLKALETADVYLEMPLHEKSADIETVLNEEHVEIMNGTKTIEDGLAGMKERIQLILEG